MDVHIPLNEKMALGKLNQALGLDLSPNQQLTPAGVKKIVDAAIEKKWKPINFHECSVAVGTVCRVALRVCGQKPVNSFPGNPLETLKEIKRTHLDPVPSL